MYDGPFCTRKYILYKKKQKIWLSAHKKATSVCLQIKKSFLQNGIKNLPVILERSDGK